MNVHIKTVSSEQGLWWRKQLCCGVWSEQINYREYVRNMIQRDLNGCFSTFLGKPNTASTRNINHPKTSAATTQTCHRTAQVPPISSKCQPPSAVRRRSWKLDSHGIYCQGFVSRMKSWLRWGPVAAMRGLKRGRRPTEAP